MDYHVQATDHPEQQEAINALLRTYNRERNPVFYGLRDLPEHLPKPLNLVAYDSANSIIGGLLAETQFEWLKIQILVVAEQVRRRGVGRRLMTMAEDEAKRRGCKRSFVDTMGFQSPDFYPRLQYELAGKLENWDSHGHAKYFYTKLLA
jgi:predicted N-acetyltransferase YhbS